MSTKCHDTGWYIVLTAPKLKSAIVKRNKLLLFHSVYFG